MKNKIISFTMAILITLVFSGNSLAENDPKMFLKRQHAELQDLKERLRQERQLSQNAAAMVTIGIGFSIVTLFMTARYEDYVGKYGLHKVAFGLMKTGLIVSAASGFYFMIQGCDVIELEKQVDELSKKIDNSIKNLN